jgi:hypothetical protein
MKLKCSEWHNYSADTDAAKTRRAGHAAARWTDNSGEEGRGIVISTEKLLWEYVRGDLEQKAFEEAIYGDLANSEYFGEDLWLEIVSTDFSNGNEKFLIKQKIRAFLQNCRPQKCRCLELRDLDVIDMAGDEESELKTLDRIVNRGEKYWWLYLSLCRECGQYWLVAQEERQNDVFVLERINETQSFGVLENNKWPSDFDKYEDLLRIGKLFGHSVRFVDPETSISLNANIEDLAEERPGIRLSEIKMNNGVRATH